MTLAHLVLSILVVASFDAQLLWFGLLFVGANYFISMALTYVVRSRSFWLSFLIAYAVYWLIYIAKAVVQHMIGFEDPYTVATIRTHVEQHDYLRALTVVTIGHAVLAGFLVAASVLVGRGRTAGRTGGHLSDQTLRVLAFLVLLWIAVSSVVMYTSGVAVMGTAGVSLPYGFSGVLFYSRTVAVPLFLLYMLAKALTKDNWRLTRQAILLFMALALSEVIVRATKAPVFVMVVQLAVLQGLLLTSGLVPSLSVRKRVARLAVLFFVGAVIAWPLMEAQRILMVSSGSLSSYREALGAYLESQDEGFALLALERLFQRLQGFLQLTGLVADWAYAHRLSAVVIDGDIASYYTESYLGYARAGHLSSPSLLGACIILGGRLFWPLVLVMHLGVMVALWRAVLVFGQMRLPLACFVVSEFVSIIIGGTLDAALLRLAMAFAFCTVVELVMRGTSGARHLRSSAAAVVA